MFTNKPIDHKSLDMLQSIHLTLIVAILRTVKTVQEFRKTQSTAFCLFSNQFVTRNAGNVLLSPNGLYPRFHERLAAMWEKIYV